MLILKSGVREVPKQTKSGEQASVHRGCVRADSKNLTCLSFAGGDGNRTGGSGVVISKAKGGEIGAERHWLCMARTVTRVQAGLRAVELC